MSTAVTPTPDADACDRTDRMFLQVALSEAASAGARGDLAVGAVIVAGQDILAGGGNEAMTSGDPMAHAEVVALRNLTAAHPGRSLEDATMYTTFEPCPMCLGACLVYRLGRVVVGGTRLPGDRPWGGYDPAGFAAAVATTGPRLDVLTGPFADECRDLRQRSVDAGAVPILTIEE
ncbi:nucleoside deaminase [Streptomyces sp. 6-11-2]|uniref:nucleoside deaminase n=1 Tax=Streptomyces sp. 6-11-2 TaxID=2585753 RepID=UPI00114261E2|nr:nucleoside deaminase [Streptomyces sp. 6-11-2]